jgi:hypothetical protein
VEQDRAYAKAMADLATAYPADLDIATLHADALFLLEPRRGSRDINDPNVQHLHHVLEAILAKDVHHPGACHLYVHATEATVAPGKAQDCAAFLAGPSPARATSTTCRLTPGTRWAGGPTRCAQPRSLALRPEGGHRRGLCDLPEHNLHMLLYAAANDGQGAISMQAGKDYAKLTGDTFYQVLTLLRFGRFDEILEVRKRPRTR